jgi:hypothetical protein
VRRALAAAAAAAAALLLPPAAAAHGIGGVRDQPVPIWRVYYGAAIVLVVSFVALGALWSKPVLDRAADGRLLPKPVQRVLLSDAVTLALRALGVALFAVVWLSAAIGSENAFQNLAPTFVYVVFWLGVPLLSALLGNVWRVLNPWRTAAELVERLRRTEPRPYPDWLGLYPAAALLFAFTALELAFYDPSRPRALAVAIAVYSVVTWAGAARYGSEQWFRFGDGFSLYFDLLGRLAPFAVRDGRIVRRAPLSGLTTVVPRPGLLAFIAVMLGSVAFDGFSRTSWWQTRLYNVQSPFLPDSIGIADLLTLLLNLSGLIGVVLLVGIVFTAALAIARRLGHADRSFADGIVASLVPVAFAYVVAHYFSLFIYQGQFAIPLLSDPLGRGWDVIGTADFHPNLTLLKPSTIWYVQAAALVTGHVCGLAVAHDRAIALLRSSREALRSQYAILVLMVIYTVGGLWILSRP